LNYRPVTAKQRDEARAVLNKEKMADLRSSHWTVGQPGMCSQTRFGRNINSNRTMPVADHVQSNVPKQQQRPESAFVTTSMVNYRWVQPYPSYK